MYDTETDRQKIKERSGMMIAFSCCAERIHTVLVQQK
jgi:hypothetical protein